MDKKSIIHVRIFRDESGIATHRAVFEPSERLKSLGLWFIHDMVEWPSSRNGYFNSQGQIFEFYSLAQFIRGEGLFSFGGKDETPRKLVPGDMVLVCPGDLQRYGGTANSVFVEDALCFKGQLADTLRRAGVLKTGVYHWGNDRTLREIIQLQANPTFSAQLRATVELHRLLVELHVRSLSLVAEENYIDGLLDSIKRDISRWWTVEQLACQAGVSQKKLRRDFLARTGMMPKAYIELQKMKTAAELLLPEYNVIQTAHHLGYRDQFHFSRRFKHCFGYPPSEQ